MWGPVSGSTCLARRAQASIPHTGAISAPHRWEWVYRHRTARPVDKQQADPVRRLRIRWEIRDDIHEAFLSLACAIICWRRLRNLSLC
jgi:hypothetical protein